MRRIMASIRKNAKPEWFPFGNSYCAGCGENFEIGENILSGLYCSRCGPRKEQELKSQKRVVNRYEFRDVCVNCGNPFAKDDSTLFGKYCSNCGKEWERERKIRQNQLRLKKARNRDIATPLPVKKTTKKAPTVATSLLTFL